MVPIFSWMSLFTRSSSAIKSNSPSLFSFVCIVVCLRKLTTFYFYSKLPLLHTWSILRLAIFDHAIISIWEHDTGTTNGTNRNSSFWEPIFHWRLDRHSTNRHLFGYNWTKVQRYGGGFDECGKYISPYFSKCKGFDLFKDLQRPHENNVKSKIKIEIREDFLRHEKEKLKNLQYKWIHRKLTKILMPCFNLLDAFCKSMYDMGWSHS